MRRKYANVKTVIDGSTFDSIKEATHYQSLKLLERAGHIEKLEVHKKFTLTVNGLDICRFEPDFVFVENGRTRVVDVKGYKNGAAWSLFRVKVKLFKAIYGIDEETV